jgi:hypothetical protein
MTCVGLMPGLEGLIPEFDPIVILNLFQDRPQDHLE